MVLYFRLLNGIVLVVDHDFSFPVGVDGDDQDHADAEDDTAVALQLVLAVLEQDLVVLVEDVRLLHVVTETAFLLHPTF